MPATFKRPFVVCWRRRNGELAMLASFAHPSSVHRWIDSRIGLAWRQTREQLFVQDRRRPALRGSER